MIPWKMIVMAHCPLRMGLFHCNSSRVAAEDLLTVVAGLVWLFQLGLFWGWGGERGKNQTMESRQRTVAHPFPQSSSQVTGFIPKWWRPVSIEGMLSPAHSASSGYMPTPSGGDWTDSGVASPTIKSRCFYPQPSGRISKMHWPTQPIPKKTGI